MRVNDLDNDDGGKVMRVRHDGHGATEYIKETKVIEND